VCDVVIRPLLTSMDSMGKGIITSSRLLLQRHTYHNTYVQESAHTTLTSTHCAHNMPFTHVMSSVLALLLTHSDGRSWSVHYIRFGLPQPDSPESYNKASSMPANVVRGHELRTDSPPLLQMTIKGPRNRGRVVVLRRLCMDDVFLLTCVALRKAAVSMNALWPAGKQHECH
jgi:hypothetical protein